MTIKYKVIKPAKCNHSNFEAGRDLSPIGDFTDINKAYTRRNDLMSIYCAFETKEICPGCNFNIVEIEKD